MSAIKSIIIFSIGAGAGSVVTYLFMKDEMDRKCEARIKEEVESVDESYSNFYSKKYEDNNAKNSGEEKSENVSDDSEELMRNATEKEKQTVSHYIHEHGYESNVPLSYDKPPIQSIRPLKDPYVISPDEFNSLAEFDTMDLIYYADGILTDEENNVIDNPSELVGEGFAEHIGDYEDDAVHIRNEKLKTDFEVLYSMKDFYEVDEEPPTT